MKKAGFPVGGVTLADEVGLDVACKITKYLGKELGVRAEANITILEEIVNAGCHGRKTGKGFYVYEKGVKERRENEDVKKILKKYSLKPKGCQDPEDIKMRVLSRFTNEAIHCLQDQILANPIEGDIGAVFGLGFPPFTGGPFRMVDNYGAAKLVAQMQRYQEAYGPAFAPCQLLLDTAKSGGKFHPGK